MIDLNKTMLPETVTVDGSVYYVQTVFKFWLRFLELIADKKTPPNAFDFMYKVEKPASRLNGVIALLQFCSPPQELPHTEKNGERVLDYALDADYLYSAFMERYRIDLLTSRMHWYKFQALLHGLHDTKLNEIISYRMWENTDGKHDAYTRRMEALRTAWELPQESDDDDEDLKAFEARLYPNR